jgi:hypothetical protein
LGRRADFKRRIFRIIPLAVAVIALVGCQQATTVNNQTPSSKKLVIDLPASLTPTAAPAAAAAAGISRATTTPPPYDSAGYATLYSALNTVEIIVPSLAVASVMIDALITQNGITPSATLHSGLHVKVTQAMLDEMKASLPAKLRAGMPLPSLGDSPIPFDFVYQVSSNPNFAFQLDLSAGGSVGETLYFSQDWSRFGISASMGGSTLSLANDTATASFAFKITGGGMDYAVKFRSDSANPTLHGAFVSLTSSTTLGSTTYSSNAAGYGDDNGGAVDFQRADMGWGAFDYLENFNAAGQVTYQAYTVNNVTTTNFGTADATYSAKLTNTSWGDAPTFFP